MRGGVDTSVNLAAVASLTAPFAVPVITPLSTIADALMRIEGLDLQSSLQRVADAMALGSTDFATNNPVLGAINGDTQATATERAGVILSSTVLLAASLYSGANPAIPLSAIVQSAYEEIASRLVDDEADLELSLPSVVEDLFHGLSTRTGLLTASTPEQHEINIQGASEIIAGAIEEINSLENTGNKAFLESLFKIKKTLQQQAAGALFDVGAALVTIESTVTNFTGAAFDSQVAVQVIGQFIPPALGISNAGVVEGNSGEKTLTFEVLLVGEHDLPVSVNFAAENFTADENDFHFHNGSLEWLPGDNTPRTITVTTKTDNLFELDEAFSVILSDATNAVIRKAVGYGFIFNDDALDVGPFVGSAPMTHQMTISDSGLELLHNGQLAHFGELAVGLNGVIRGADNVNDTFILDLSYSSYRDDTITFMGGNGTGFDTVQIFGGIFASITQKFHNATDGQTLFAKADQSSTPILNWIGMEPFLINSGSVDELIFELPAGVTDAILEDADPNDADSLLAGKMQLRSLSGHFETTIFNAPELGIIIKGGNGLDSLTIGELDPDFAGYVRVDTVALGNAGVDVVFNGWTSAGTETISGQFYQTYVKGVAPTQQKLLIQSNTAPTANAGGPYVVAEGIALTLDASSSSDAEQATNTLLIEWDLNYDGVNFDVDLVGLQPSVTYQDEFSSRTIAVRVTDSASVATMATTTLEVTNVPVSFDLGSDRLLLPADTGLFQLSNIPFSDSGTDTWTATVDFGDGTGTQSLPVDALNKSVSLSHQYLSSGPFTVTVTIDDGDGGSATDSMLVTVPTAVISLGASSYIYNEDGTPQGTSLTVTRTGHLSSTVTGSLNLINGTATGVASGSNGDFINQVIPVTFAQGQSTTTITLPIIDDFLIESQEAFQVTLNAGQNSSLGSTTSATITIISNDSTTVINTLDSGPGSLRAAILVSNATPGVQTVNFAIPGPGVKTFQPASALPIITDTIHIDGTTQNGYNGVPLIQLAGNLAGAGVNGLNLQAANSTIRGLLINRFGGAGIYMANGGGSTIAGNHIGINTLGNSAQGNAGNGIFVLNSPNNIIGGTSAADRNVISANGQYGIHLRNAGTTNNQVLGNYIGTTSTGDARLGNALSGIIIFNAVNNKIGGTQTGAGNVVSGNTEEGIYIVGAATSGNTIQGNLVGTTSTGTTALANRRSGIYVYQSPNNTIGGAVPGAANVISGNFRYGVAIEGETATQNVVQGNYVGTDLTGSQKIPNQTHGVFIQDAPQVSIGGTTPGAGNVVAGNALHGIYLRGVGTINATIQGNFVGTNPSNSVSVGNGVSGIYVYQASNNTIGGTTTNSVNILSGNSQNGLALINSAGNTVQGNYIGTNTAGTAALKNTAHGIYLENAPDNLIGGLTSAAGNLISGNNQHGIYLRDPGTLNNDIFGNWIGLNQAGTGTIANGSSGIYAFRSGGNSIGSDLPGSGNVISGNTAHGIYLSTTNSYEVQNNRLGTNSDGTIDFGNNLNGVYLLQSHSNYIGLEGVGNLISGNNRNGIEIDGPLSINNVVESNYIGTNLAGTSAIANSAHGVFITEAPDNRVGGDTNSLAGNLISGNTQHGIYLRGFGTVRSSVQGNYIGINADASSALPNRASGIYGFRASQSTIGGSELSQGNVISGNAQQGIYLESTNTFSIISNLIGTDDEAISAIGNVRNGILIDGGTGHFVGGAPQVDNVIAFNGLAGIRVLGTGTQVAIHANSLYGNAGLGIDLQGNGVTPNDVGDADTGPNRLQNFPVISRAVLNGGFLSIDFAVPSASPAVSYPLYIEFYRADLDQQEGAEYLGYAIYTESSQQNTLNVTLDVGNLNLEGGDRIVATATDAMGNTSEFSASFLVSQTAPPPQSFVFINVRNSNTISRANTIGGFSDEDDQEDTHSSYAAAVDAIFGAS